MRERKSPARSPGRATNGLKLAREVRIGISGWTYKPWRGVFYPPKHPQKRELDYASRVLNTIEINGTFYSLQRPTSFQKWYAETPAGFVFSVKGARFITHMKKLRDVEVPLANFFASGVLCLGEKLGPILWQFPPNFGWNERRFREFFALLPRDTGAAARLSRRHNEKLKCRAWTKTDVCRPLRYAVEIRHPSFLVPDFFALLRQSQIAFVFADTAGRWPYAEELTTDFVYCRLHGDEQLYVSGYSESALGWWAERLRRWGRGRDLFVYFDNDAKVHAPVDAQRLATLLAQ
ncbi:MAG: DUF72 domain-containing protein [Chthoniobacterales bacterium]|nr:DUF72 domain-containing protein [Chthoniobacterales bacterium]